MVKKKKDDENNGVVSTTGRQGKKAYVVTSSIPLPGYPPLAQQTPAARMKMKKSKNVKKKRGDR